MLRVSEIFGPTIQGEGKNSGMPCAFLRLAHCNLTCSWCDTKHTWSFIGQSKDPEQYRYEDEVHVMSNNEVYHKLHITNMKSLVISGGEPLVQQRQLIELCDLLKRLNWWIEVETNGTLLPTAEFTELVDQFNCSPKLANSDVELHKRIKPRILGELAKNPKVFFKFVISNKEDCSEVIDLVHQFALRQVYLMPCGKTQEELAHTTDLVRDLASRHEFLFSRRLHVERYGHKRGV